MKTIIYLCFAALILASCGGQPTDGWTTYTSPAENFSVMTPPGSRVESEGDSDVTFQLPTGARIMLAIIDKPADPVGDENAISNLVKLARDTSSLGTLLLVDSGSWTIPIKANYVETIDSDLAHKMDVHSLLISAPLTESSHVIALAMATGKLTDEEKAEVKTIISTLHTKE